MLIIPIKEGENIDRAVKKYKKKFERTGAMRELRDRQKFTKPSVRNREQLLKAIYKEQMKNAEE
ncbi:MAG: 30S ribosomal protein S21 [Crocinitomicaceae bacterium]|nr:30S ribosomal protein S21 [Crocinitomicaceae bacterium]|tara:strand:- start:1679 stop:1870 length:192 start_codon:yes stop_codon:yes gene_type:complete